MNIETLKKRIISTAEKITRKENTIVKKEKSIQKKSDELLQLGVDNPKADKMKYRNNEVAYWLLCDVESLKEDIEKGIRDIKNLKANLEKYEQQLEMEMNKEETLLKDIPEILRQMQVQLVSQWDSWDIERRNTICIDHQNLDWLDFCLKYSPLDIDFAIQTDEQIHNNNVQDANGLILDLYYRVKAVTGEITDWSHIHACQGTRGALVLNGIVTGKDGIAEIESIVAGGYNIQKLHIRVLVKNHKGENKNVY